MLLGYDKNGEIKFIFTDQKYLDNKFPDNSAKISNFWGNGEHGLTEFFVSSDAFKDLDNLKHYKIVNGNLTKKTEEEISKIRKILKAEPENLIIEGTDKNCSTINITTKGKI